MHHHTDNFRALYYLDLFVFSSLDLVFLFTAVLTYAMMFYTYTQSRNNMLQHEVVNTQPRTLMHMFRRFTSFFSGPILLSGRDRLSIDMIFSTNFLNPSWRENHEDSKTKRRHRILSLGNLGLWAPKKMNTALQGSLFLAGGLTGRYCLSQ